MILMLQNFDQIKFLTRNEQQFEKIETISALPTYSDEVISFLSDVSLELLKNPKIKDFPDVASYAFFIRKSSLEKIKKENLPSKTRLGRGIALHVAPSNVPVNFAVSLMDGLLAGNINVVRVSDKQFEQVDMICEAINKIAETKYKNMKNYIYIIRYPHNEEITKELSSICDLRIVWGGNRTINEIRKAPIPPRAAEYCFADRHSLSVINSNFYLNQDSSKVARDFYVDTYWTDQNACSSPRLIVWTGTKIKEAKEKFWKILNEFVQKDYQLQTIKVVDKLDAFCRLASVNEDIHLIHENNSIYRVEVKNLSADLLNYKESAGFFFEYETQNLGDIVPVLTKPAQTISYLGVDSTEIEKIVLNAGPRGCDRIVPMGKTMDISIFWDGLNMVNAMSRLIFRK